MAKLAYLKGFLWFTFSGTAMLSAFILPVHIWAHSTGEIIINLTPLFFRFYFFVLIICALYHGLYRTKTILFDLGIAKGQTLINVLLIILFFVFTLAAAVYCFVLGPAAQRPIIY